MPYLSDPDDSRTLRNIEEWKQVVLEEIDEIGSWRSDPKKYELHCGGIPAEPNMFYTNTSILVGLIARNHPNLDAGPIQDVYEAIKVWHGRGFNDLPSQAALEAKADRAVQVLQAVEGIIYSRAIRPFDQEALIRKLYEAGLTMLRWLDVVYRSPNQIGSVTLTEQEWEYDRCEYQQKIEQWFEAAERVGADSMALGLIMKTLDRFDQIGKEATKTVKSKTFAPFPSRSYKVRESDIEDLRKATLLLREQLDKAMAGEAKGAVDDSLWRPAKWFIDKGWVTNDGRLSKMAKAHPEIRKKANDADRERLKNPKLRFLFSEVGVYKLTEGKADAPADSFP